MDYFEVISTAKPNISELPGGWEPILVGTKLPKMHKALVNGIMVIDSDAKIISDVITPQECLKLINLMGESPRIEPVTVQGTDISINDAVGSHRVTMWSPEIAQQLWYRLKDFMSVETFNEFSSTDWWQGDKNRTTWEPIGISPMLRFMRYEKGGEHYAHYDAGFIYPDDNYRTLKSVVIYLTTSPEGGCTRFIDDKQANIPVWHRDHFDWTRTTTNKEVLEESPAIAGNVLIFDHRKCHDVQQFTGDSPRIIIRTDILYKAV